METKFVLESSTEINKPNILNFLDKNKFPPGIDDLIVIYIVHKPWEEFIESFLIGDMFLMDWLLKIYKFHKRASKKRIIDSYDTKICLADYKFRNLYIKIFKHKFVKEGNFQYHPYRCFKTTLENNNPNYIDSIEYFNKVYKDKGKDLYLGVMVEYGCVDALKYAIEEVKWKFNEEYLANQFGTNNNNQDMLRYLCSIIKDDIHKDELLANYLRSFVHYARENSDTKKITEYCKPHIDMIREVVNNLKNAERHPIINLMWIAYDITRPDYDYDSDDDERKEFEWITVDFIICLIKIIPLTSTQITMAKDTVVNYLTMVNNPELLDIIEKNIDYKLSSLKEAK